MRHPTTLITTIALTAGLLAVGAPAGAKECVDGERIFTDVPFDHPFCEEIESLYRDGLTSGCRVEDDGTRYFCPNEAMTRGMAAVFTERRDLFAQVDPLGDVQFGDHVVGAERVQRGVYFVQFTRVIEGCSMEGWSPDLFSFEINVRVGRLLRSGNTVSVETQIDGQSVDAWFNVRLHCR